MKQTQMRQVVGPNGKLPVRMGWGGGYQQFEITGGPYDGFKFFSSGRQNAFGVCVRAEQVPKDLDLHLPIKDFDVPKDDVLVREALRRTIQAALDGRQVYVGCMGGWGRTGLFLALLAKACGEDDPVAYVRKNYTPRAVETPQQYDYVAKFDVSELRSWLFWAGWQKKWVKTIFWWQ